MKVRMYQIIALEELYPKIKDQTFSLSTNYRFAKLFNAIHAEYSIYKNGLQKLIDKYAQRDENGNFIYNENSSGIQIKPESLSEFQNQLYEFYNLDTELPDISFNLSELEDISSLSIEELNLLIPFINE